MGFGGGRAGGAWTYPQARLRIFQPQRSCTALGYMVDSREVLVAPQKNKPPANPDTACQATATPFPPRAAPKHPKNNGAFALTCQNPDLSR